MREMISNVAYCAKSYMTSQDKQLNRLVVFANSRILRTLHHLKFSFYLDYIKHIQYLVSFETIILFIMLGRLNF